jgi:hypothetical protein
LLLGGPVLAVLALLLGGCSAGQSCINSFQCGEGLVCMHWRNGPEAEGPGTCAKPCAIEQDRCDTGEACMCPDSPLKARCFDDAGERIAICELPPPGH